MKDSRRLTQKARINLGMITGEEHHKKTYHDDDIPGDDDDHQPTGDKFNNGEGDECSKEKELVSDGIEVST